MVLSAFLDETVKPKNLCVAQHPSFSWSGWAPLNAVCYECSWCCIRSGGPCLGVCQGSKCTHMCMHRHITCLCIHVQAAPHSHSCSLQPHTHVCTHMSTHLCIRVHEPHTHIAALCNHTHACTHIHMPLNTCASATHSHTHSHSWSLQPGTAPVVLLSAPGGWMDGEHVRTRAFVLFNLQNLRTSHRFPCSFPEVG